MDYRNIELNSYNNFKSSQGSLNQNGYTNGNNQQKKIKIINQSTVTEEIDNSKKGMKLLVTLWAIFTITGFWLLISAESFFNAYMSIVVILFFGVGGIFAYRKMNINEGYYIPNKSFKEYRFKDPESFMKSYNKGRNILIAFFALSILLAALISGAVVTDVLKIILFAILSIPVMSYYKKSIKFHEDVDFNANQNISDLVGCQVDEKIVASYQSFKYDESIKEKDLVFLLTNLKLFFACYQDSQWHKMCYSLSDISEFGLLTRAKTDTYLGDTYIVLHFFDKTSLCVKLDYRNPTTNGALFVNKFLKVLDCFLLGQQMPQKNRHRRVVTAKDETCSQSESNVQTNAVRSIELQDAVIEQIKAGEDFQIGRNIEL